MRTTENNSQIPLGLPNCVRVVLGSVFPGIGDNLANHQSPQNHWTQEPMPKKIHHSGFIMLDTGKVTGASEELIENE